MKQMNEEEAYKNYMADSLFYSAQQKRITSRFYDLLNKKVETRSGDEIVEDVIKRAGIRIEKEKQNGQDSEFICK